MATAKKEVAAKGSTDVSVYDYGVDTSNDGFENQTKADLAIPFINVLQALSPQVSEELEGAKPGKLFNTVTEEIMDDVLFVPGMIERKFIEWVPRKRGGGLVGTHAPNSDVVNQAIEKRAEHDGRLMVEGEGGLNDLTETFELYGAILDDDLEVVGMGVISCTSSKIKVYRKWNTKMRMCMIKVGDRKVRPPLFAHCVRVSSTRETNNSGDVYYNISLQPYKGAVVDSLLEPGHPALEAAQSVANLVKSGEARAAYETNDGEGSGTAAEEEIPF